ncbi:MAG: hypothetical protein FWG40_03640 [Peptococcaceae bacterium]|nr:hypothetical protein [Peptococcaceae bacterium]
MQTSVELQAPFSYAILPIIILLLLFVAMLVFMFISQIINKKNTTPEAEFKPVFGADLDAHKLKYLRELEEVACKLQSEEIDGRTAYQQLSMTIRLFVYEVTHIKVQNYTLSDIASINMPLLYELIREYYAPEFSKESEGEILSSIEGARKVIERWK